MGEPVKWPPWAGTPVRVRLANLLDLPNLRRRRTAGVRYDAIFGIHVGELDRLASLRKQIDDRGAAESQHVGTYRSLQLGNRTIEINKDFQAAAAGKQRLGIEAVEIDEQEFLWKSKIFTEQAETGKAAGRPG